MVRKRKGFTLIEMVIVMLIISMLLLLIVPNLAEQKNVAQTRADEAVTETIQSQVNMSNADEVNKYKGPDKLKDWPALSSKQRNRAKSLKLYINEKGKVVSSDPSSKVINDAS
ncbi:competence type IV pilus major pilin ComGC [Companilactobacillus furfuricola]|uniref:competence type IV pilus major pilin ComGC n=1 Tax=Companilactobacillus furfuricola TaxID=1462575 RepID=UPI000F78942D|nr:competence type IV pilus major pilin ComGC [Companilactobacillus furfuricola]